MAAKMGPDYYELVGKKQFVRPRDIRLSKQAAMNESDIACKPVCWVE